MTNTVNNFLNELVANVLIFSSTYHYITIAVIILLCARHIADIMYNVADIPSPLAIAGNILAIILYITVPPFAYIMAVAYMMDKEGKVIKA